jgi:hypothetical protein
MIILGREFDIGELEDDEFHHYDVDAPCWDEVVDHANKILRECHDEALVDNNVFSDLAALFTQGESLEVYDLFGEGKELRTIAEAFANQCFRRPGKSGIGHLVIYMIQHNVDPDYDVDDDDDDNDDDNDDDDDADNDDADDDDADNDDADNDDDDNDDNDDADNDDANDDDDGVVSGVMRMALQ